MIISRRGFLSGLSAGLFVAPAIVRASSLMPVKKIILPVTPDRFLVVRGIDVFGDAIEERIPYSVGQPRPSMFSGAKEFMHVESVVVVPDFCADSRSVSSSPYSFVDHALAYDQVA